MNGHHSPSLARRHNASNVSLSTLDETKPADPDDLNRGIDDVLAHHKVAAAPNINDDGGGSGSDEHTSTRMPPVSILDGSSAWAPGRSGVLPMSMTFVSPWVVAMIVTWYISGALTNSTSKQCLNLFKEGPAARPPPFFSLTLCQHLCATLCGLFALKVIGLRRYKPLPAAAQESWGFYRMVLVYAGGFCLTNGSFGAVNASFVDTIKAGEPIATMILTVVFLSADSVTLPICLSLLPIVGGVGLSSMSEASFNMRGFCMAMGANLCFSARSIFAKMLRSELGRTMDNANLFLHVNLWGACLLLPITFYMEGPLLINLLTQADRPAKLFLINGLLYYVNNQMNFLVLEKVDAVTHGLINCGRRVANIGFAIVWFGIPVTLYNGIGISLALLGAFLYIRAKQSMNSSIQHSAAPSSKGR